MKRARISLLVAAAVIVGAPTLASAQDNQDRRHEDRGGDRGGRGAPPPVQDRRSQPAPPQQPGPRPEAPRQAPTPPQQQFQQQRPAGQDNGDRRMRDGGQFGRGAPPQQPQFQQDRQGWQDHGDRRMHDGGAFGRGGQQQPPQFQSQQPPNQQGRPQGDPDRRFGNGGDRPNDFRGGYDGYRGGDDRRPNPPPPGGYRGPDGRGGAGQAWHGDGQRGRDYGRPGYNRPAWRGDWRGDNRYNWRGWRDHNRQLFRAPRYIPPRGYGWGYRSFGVGYVLDSFLFAPNYWISDPWEYRLPPVYGPYRWVRYYNDVLLVDIETGEVVDVIQNFFW